MRHSGQRGTKRVQRQAKKPGAPSLPVLIVQHAPHEHPAIIRRALESQGIQTQLVHPYRGEGYPAVSEIHGMISLGGPMSANDEAIHPWIRPEIQLIGQCVAQGLPTIGICLGGQLMARSQGAEVVKNSVAEVGWFPIQMNQNGLNDRIMGSAGRNPLVFHWHNDTFQVPNGAVLLAHSQACSRQVYRIGEHAYGFQFHPEADHQLVHEWLAVEDVEQEIIDTQKVFGTISVQDADAQKSFATQGEKASLKITAAIAQSFQPRDYSPISHELYEQIEAWGMLRTRLFLELEGPDRKTFRLRGSILMYFTIADGEFIIFREENTLLWPIRMDDIKKIEKV